MTAKQATSPAGLRAAKVAIPALYIPSAIAVFGFMVAGKTDDWFWVLACLLAAGGFELVNYSLSRLDLPPAVLTQAQRVRLFSAATAIVLGWLHHYEQRVANAWNGAPFDPLAAFLALASSLPIVLIALGMGALVNTLSAQQTSRDDAAAQLRADVAQARAAQERAQADLAQERARADRATVERDALRAGLRSAEDALRDRDVQAAQERAAGAQQAAQAAQERADELASLRSEVDQLRSGRDEARETARQLRSEAEQLRTAQTAAAQQDEALRTEAQRLRDELAQRAQALHEAQDALAQLLGAGDVDRLRLAQQLVARGVSQRETADLVGMKESTLRSQLKARSNGHAVAEEAR